MGEGKSGFWERWAGRKKGRSDSSLPEDQRPAEATPADIIKVDSNGREGTGPEVGGMTADGHNNSVRGGISRAGETTTDPVRPAPRWLGRLATGLKKSSDRLAENIVSVFNRKTLDSETLEALEDILIQADLGIDTAAGITGKLARERLDKHIDAEQIRALLREEIVAVLAPVATPLVADMPGKPHVILMVGVNGSGKTTTIGKLTARFAGEGKKVLLAAGDTFRAAAVEQLQIWGQRAHVDVVAGPIGADASGLVFDAMTRAGKTGADILIIDTAGRMQNRDELMAELEKIIRVIKKIDETAPHTTLLTLDATTGQNALGQVEVFGRRAGVSGLVMTKLDGTARGGILVAISNKYKLPVHYVGVGEGVDDLLPFNAHDFASAIVGAEVGHASSTNKNELEGK